MISDLETQLQAVLQAVREQTTHAARCMSVTIGLDDIGVRLGRMAGEPMTVCTCDWQARMEAEVARRWAASIKAAAMECVRRLYHTEGIPQSGLDAALEEAAALAAEALHVAKRWADVLRNDDGRFVVADADHVSNLAATALYRMQEIRLQEARERAALEGAKDFAQQLLSDGLLREGR